MFAPKKYRGKVAYSKYLGSCIRVTTYLTSNKWVFVRCDRRGVWKDSKKMWAGSNIDVFDWEDIV